MSLERDILVVYSSNLVSSVPSTLIDVGNKKDVVEEVYEALATSLKASPDTQNNEKRVFEPELKPSLNEQFSGDTFETTVKLFLPNESELETTQLAPSLGLKGVDLVLDYLKLDTIDTLILSLANQVLSDLDEEMEEDQVLEKFLPMYKELEKSVESGKVKGLATCEFNQSVLEKLKEKVKVQPEANQINLSDCCVIPTPLRTYAKLNHIKLLTHNDPPNLFHSSHFCHKLLPNLDKQWKPQFLVRYNVLVKSRGIVANKGYILLASK